MRKVKYKAGPVLLLALFALYLFVLFQITIFREASPEMRSVNVIPFRTIAEYVQSIISGNKIIGIFNLFGNLVLFFPLGYLSALLFPKMRKLTRILVLAFVFSLFIEGFQYIFACGRADIDDVILNTLGGAAGYGVYSLVSRFSKPQKYAIFISVSLLMIACTCLGLFVVNHFRVDQLPDVPLSPREATRTEWCLILVNKWNYVPDDYQVELTELANGQAVDERIYPALQEMFDAARREGVYPVVFSGYRTAEQQQNLLDEKMAAYRAEGYSAEEARTKAEEWVAMPGTSEHQLGIAVDINADGVQSAGYEVYEWLDQNAHKFGFIRRYPPDKTEITGVSHEPWHYRYVGTRAATEMQNQGVCLEEYLREVI